MLYEFKAEQKQLIVHDLDAMGADMGGLLPFNLKSKLDAVVEGPLAFVFGGVKEKLKNRYAMDVATPADLVGQQIWIDAWPKKRQDASSFSKLELILREPDLTPYAVKMLGTNGKSAKVYIFTEPSVNSALAKRENWTNPLETPAGWERIELQQTAIEQKSDSSPMTETGVPSK